MTSIWGMEWTTDSTQCFTECRTWRRRSFPKHVTRRISRRSSWPKWWPKWFKSFFCRDRWDSQDGWTAWTSWNLEPVWFQDLILSQSDKCAFLLFGDSFALFQLCLIHWSKLYDFPINFAFILIITRSSSRRLALPLGLDMLRIFYFPVKKRHASITLAGTAWQHQTALVSLFTLWWHHLGDCTWLRLSMTL